ncbi:MAG: hypothetical protein HYU51_03135 [Candidatus Rokubacteria bacterium]|nr:hypothetical protein [Candidatus Rokubacteria bacterium]
MQGRTIVRRHTETTQEMLLAPRRSTSKSPGLRVFLTVGIGPLSAPRARVALVKLAGGVAPVRLSLYVNGDLIESWMPAHETCELLLPALLPGRHALTVRAVDARGRWGGASAIVQAAV